MDREYNSVSDLIMYKSEWKLRLRMIRTWISFFPGKTILDGSFEAVGLEEQGNLIHVFTERHHKPHFKNLLRKGRIYNLMDFRVVPELTFRPVFKEYLIKIHLGTTVIEEADNVAAIPLHKFQFVDYAALMSRFGDNLYLSVISRCGWALHKD